MLKNSKINKSKFDTTASGVEFTTTLTGFEPIPSVIYTKMLPITL